jgi:hypothetical protein
MGRILTFALALGSTLFGLALAEWVCRRLEITAPIRREQAGDPENPPWGWRGVRRFGDLNTRRTRVMVLGDSYTASRGVEDGEDYSTLLGRMPGVEIFSYGGEGYSTAQELMVFRRFGPRVQPSLVLLQTSTNDFINNSAELESTSLINNNLKVRPYLEAGRMVLRYPRFGGSLRARLVNDSALGRRIFYALDQGRAWFALRGWLDTVENEIGPDLGGHAGFRRSVETTETLLVMLRDEARPAPLMVFPADGIGPDAPFRLELAALCARQGIPFLESLPDVLDAADSPEDSVYLKDDPHWSARGHALAADELIRWVSPALKH